MAAPMKTRYREKNRVTDNEKITKFGCVNQQFSMEEPSDEFADDIRLDKPWLVPEWLSVGEKNVQNFYANAEGIPQVIMNGKNWNCRTCYKPPTRKRILWYPSDCQHYLEFSRPHFFCTSCKNEQLNKCGICQDLSPESWIHQKLPQNVLEHMSLVGLGFVLKRERENRERLMLMDLQNFTEAELEDVMERDLHKCDFMQRRREFLNQCSATKRRRREEKIREVNREVMGTMQGHYSKVLCETKEKDEKAEEGSEKVLARRLDDITKGESLVCGACFRVFRYPMEKLRHFEAVHPEFGYKEKKKEGKNVKCYMEGCEFMGRDLWIVDRHVRGNKCPTNNVSVKAKKTCVKCGKECRDAFNKQRH